MKRIVVNCPHGQMNLLIEDAERLAATINEEIVKARKSDGPLRAFIERDEYFCREELYQFFRQSLPEQYISRRIGKLYAAIVRAGSPEWRSSHAELPLGIVCANCNSSLDKTCRKPFGESGHRYYRNDWEYYINISALERHAAEFLPGGSRELSGKILGSFRLLMDNLE